MLADKKHYLNGGEALDCAFDQIGGKLLRKINNIRLTISSGGSHGLYWGESFAGSIKFAEFEDRRLLLWLGQTSERNGDDSYPSLWYQNVPRTDNMQNATRLMGARIDLKVQNGFALAFESMSVDRRIPRESMAQSERDNYGLFELNKLPDNWFKGTEQHSRVPIRKLSTEFEFGKILPHQVSPRKYTLILYKPSVVDYIIKQIKGA